MTRPIQLPSTTGLDMNEAKQELRAAVRAHRATRPARARQAAAAAFARHGLEAVGDAQCVACYVSAGAEPDTTLLLDALRDAGRRVLLPVLGPGLARSWAEYRGRDDLQVQAPGRPPEPAGAVFDADELAAAEAVIIPGLAVDPAGTRLGQGGGWYDRALLSARASTPVFVMVHDAELLSDVQLPRAEHDVPVHAVITEERWFLLDGSPLRTPDRSPAEG